MICPDCMKNIVKIVLKEDGYRHILCENCQWEVTITSGSPDIQFFLFNYDLDIVFKEGRSAYLQGVSITDNPWSLIDEDGEHAQWEGGWKFGSICMEKMGFISPLEKEKQMEKKIEKQQKFIEKLTKEKTSVNNAIFEFTQNIENIENT